jgi:hypothetical protein
MKRDLLLFRPRWFDGPFIEYSMRRPFSINWNASFDSLLRAELGLCKQACISNRVAG